MIQELVDAYFRFEGALKQSFVDDPPENYKGIFTRLCKFWSMEEEYSFPDPERIVDIDHGDYQGTKVFVVGSGGYQPYYYWTCKISYGSCSYCDTFQAAQDSDDFVGACMTLALHMVQSMKEV